MDRAAKDAASKLPDEQKKRYQELEHEAGRRRSRAGRSRRRRR